MIYFHLFLVLGLLSLAISRVPVRFHKVHTSKVKPEDDLLIEDTALVLDNINLDIGEFEEIKNKIRYLEATIKVHSRRRVVDGGQIREADLVLQELNAKVVEPFEEHLVALKAQIMKPHIKYDKVTILQINKLIKTAELFLETAKYRVSEVEKEERGWEQEEQAAKGKQEEQVAIGRQEDAKQKLLSLRKTSEVWEENLKQKLEVGNEDGSLIRKRSVKLEKPESVEVKKIQKRNKSSFDEDRRQERNMYNAIGNEIGNVGATENEFMTQNLVATVKEAVENDEEKDEFDNLAEVVQDSSLRNVITSDIDRSGLDFWLAALPGLLVLVLLALCLLLLLLRKQEVKVVSPTHDEQSTPSSSALLQEVQVGEILEWQVKFKFRIPPSG